MTLYFFARDEEFDQIIGDRALRILDSSFDPLTLDPHRSFDPDSEVIMSQIYEGLIDYNHLGQLTPRLATKWKRLSATRYRFWLRQGVRFHNGEPFDASAVRFSLRRQISRRPKSANSWLFDPGLHAEVLGSHVVDLVTSRPDSRLPYTLPMFVKILPPKYIKQVGAKGLREHPVGTGPYMFVNWVKGKSISLLGNPHYWKKGLPRIKNVEFHFLPQREQVAALLQGRVDLVTKLPGKETLTIMAGSNTRVQKKHVAMVFWAAMKNQDGPFADRRVRQAMNHAINKQHLIQYVDKGNSLQVSTMTNPIELDFNPNLRPYPFDPAKARRLLQEAGYGRGFRFRTLASEETKYMIRAIQAQLKMVGVEMDLTTVPRKEYLRRTILPKLRTGKPDFDGDMVVWLTPNPTLDASFIPGVIFYSKSPYSIMNDPVFDRLYLSFVHESDPAKRRGKLFTLQSHMSKEAYGIYTSQRILTYGLHWDLDVKLHPSGMLVGFTLPEASWRSSPRSVWDVQGQGDRRQPDVTPLDWQP